MVMKKMEPYVIQLVELTITVLDLFAGKNVKTGLMTMVLLAFEMLIFMVKDVVALLLTLVAATNVYQAIQTMVALAVKMLNYILKKTMVELPVFLYLAKKVKSRAELYATRNARLAMQVLGLFVGSLVLELIHTIVVYFVQRTIMIVLIHLLLLRLFLLLH